jgi:hypothetical protein
LPESGLVLFRALGFFNLFVAFFTAIVFLLAVATCNSQPLISVRLVIDGQRLGVLQRLGLIQTL